MQDLLTTACTAVEIAAAALFILAAISPRKSSTPAVAQGSESTPEPETVWPSCDLLGNPALFGSDVVAKKKILAGLATHPVVLAAPQEHIDAILAPTPEAEPVQVRKRRKARTKKVAS
jgi:hypothetical protein